MREYLSFSLKLLLAFGLSFELPVIIFFMVKIGVVSSKMLAKQRRYAILVIFVAAALLTPSPDALTQIIMAIPLMGLYEIGIFVAKFAEKKRPKADNEKDNKEET
jgi:sec-independent protein translocase protein TatC